MRFITRRLFPLLLLMVLLVTAPACHRKTGCPINENAHSISTDKEGNIKQKKGKSNLFPKKMRKKKKRG